MLPILNTALCNRDVGERRTDERMLHGIDAQNHGHRYHMQVAYSAAPKLRHPRCDSHPLRPWEHGSDTGRRTIFFILGFAHMPRNIADHFVRADDDLAFMLSFRTLGTDSAWDAQRCETLTPRFSARLPCASLLTPLQGCHEAWIPHRILSSAKPRPAHKHLSSVLALDS